MKVGLRKSAWLTSDPLTKTVSLLGSIGDQKAIINLEKTAFHIAPENLAGVVDGTIMPWLHLIQRNDIYRWYLGGPSPGRSHSKATLIYPATEVHIRKQEKQPRRMVRETPEIYEQYVEKYIETMKGPRIQWYVYPSTVLTRGSTMSSNIKLKSNE